MTKQHDFEDLDKNLDWAKGDGLLPAIVQDADDGRVLMLGYMNAEALETTRSSGRVTFYSRSKQRLWTKGETSGNHLDLVEVLADCDRDSLLILARAHGPTCHTGTDTCFGDLRVPKAGFLASLERTVQSRAGADPENSYTARLLAEGRQRCAQKVAEEGVEVALAATSGVRDEVVAEAADLLYHLLVCLQSAGSNLDEVIESLVRRRRR